MPQVVAAIAIKKVRSSFTDMIAYTKGTIDQSLSTWETLFVIVEMMNVAVAHVRQTVSVGVSGEESLGTEPNQKSFEQDIFVREVRFLGRCCVRVSCCALLFVVSMACRKRILMVCNGVNEVVAVE